jgi:putative PIG3 family NAD(P)H quinone oxidoreductase
MPARMRAIAIGDDKDKSLSVVEVPLPEPKPGEVRIKIAYSGLNRADLLQRRGFYPPPAGASPIMGMEITGVVEALGAGAGRWKEGDRVCTVMPGGGYAEFATVDAGAVLPIPAPLSLEEACAIPEAACTVWQCVFEMGALKPGETLLLHGGASGVGVIGIQMAVAHGAKVFSTAGDDEKCALVTRLGARAINYRAEDFEAIVRAEGRTDVVLDMVGGDYVQKNFACLNPDGRCVQIAFLHGSKVTVDLMPIMLKRILFTGATLRGRNDAEKARLSAEVEKYVWPWIASGKVKPVIDSVFALEDVEDAHARMAASKHAGKIILKVA